MKKKNVVHQQRLAKAAALAGRRHRGPRPRRDPRVGVLGVVVLTVSVGRALAASSCASSSDCYSSAFVATRSSSRGIDLPTPGPFPALVQNAFRPPIIMAPSIISRRPRLADASNGGGASSSSRRRRRACGRQAQQGASLRSRIATHETEAKNDQLLPPPPPPPPPPQRLVLIGGGHAHVQVIKALRSRPQQPDELQVVLIDSQTSASYSGMVPGCIAGMYRPHETLIDLTSLAKASQIQFVHGVVTNLCLSQKQVSYRLVSTSGITETGEEALRDDVSLSFDVVSIDIGSSSRDWDSIPGAKQHSIPTRPINRLVERLDDARARLFLHNKETDRAVNAGPHVVVVGGGAAGLELAMAVMARWRPDVPSATCTIVNAAPQLLSSVGGGGLGSGDGTTSYQQDELLDQVVREKRIRVMNSCAVQQVHEDLVTIVDLKDATVHRIPATHGIWAAGAGPTPLARMLLKRRKQHVHDRNADAAVLDMTDDGWITVGATLQSTSHPFVFAAGDCASIRLDDDDDDAVHHRPSTVVPKAGVYAVRAGPVLIENLTRYLDRLRIEAAGSKFDGSDVPQPLVKYQPQDDFLKLIVCDREEAIGFRFGLALRGRWVWNLKDRIDQTFMNLFRVDVDSENATGDNGTSRGASSKYDTSQYDSSIDADPTLVLPPPQDAAALLRRHDENVDHLLAWKVLRSMANDKEYRDAVLSHCNVQVEREVS